ncbi:hypothetical protein FRX31_027735 [Thalictrum thalictroides]|uniref:Uncharacterized protein n=1 Tax=Thalictrum thalictroides TaxID=46969 RepID=A0A7J6VEN4_THATH|nr:hypothetical protein FRX31_027735 [Thalictrum thalictroides]
MNRENEIIAEDKHEFSAIDVDDGISFLADNIQSSIPPDPSTLCSIYRVPDNLKKGYEDKYEPSAVSIGPYHHAKQNLKITEKNKLWYLGKFMSRSTPPQMTSLKDMVKAVKNLEEKARACYAEEIHLSSDDFVKMMVIDGCFILELFYRKWENRKEDLIYSAPWVIETVKQDLVLLENQLPLSVLLCLYRLIHTPRSLDPDRFLMIMVTEFFPMSLSKLISRENMVESSHLLDFLRNCLIPCKYNPISSPILPGIVDFYSAKDLREMGVKFKRESKTPFLDVTFEEGYLAFDFIPHETIYSLFPNWIALEQCHRHFKGCITSYIILLGQLVNSKDDTKILRKSEMYFGNENEDDKFVTEIKMLCQRVMTSTFPCDNIPKLVATDKEQTCTTGM